MIGIASGLRRSPLLGASVACGLLLSACSGAAGDAGGETTEAQLGDARARVDRLYTGTHTPPPAESPKPAAGKNLWVISYGQSFVSSATAAAAAKQAAESMGWRVTVVDAKFNPATAVDGMRQAIAAKADALFSIYWDCSAVKAGLIAARQAKVVTAVTEAQQCEGNPLYDHVISYNPGFYKGNDGGFLGYLRGWAAALADYTIVKTDGKAKVIVFSQTDTVSSRITYEGYVEQLKTCGGCEVVNTVEYVGSEIGPPLQQKAEQALLRSPDANAVTVSGDAILTGGVIAALKSSGRYGKIVIAGGEGGEATIPLMKTYPGWWGFSNLPIAWEGWGAVDAINRIFNGQKPASTGVGYQIVDKGHNTPPGDQAVAYKDGAPVDFASLYRKAWSTAR
ncbi:sugar ABC transporter substrate-binding protein [Actinomadura spongiicola]|uniref:Sugar ABC transporter substrate-binding protein n=1 Tax=Actinomadura spongiicola TaxID=2303421 RepID=A0A372GPT0_9ACTN|nr:substrate-binding domain-containing protein [Actinomadura spongiicola]RFS87386.1 sugar ABC transporter substrate-binding protein [Actinomadura spongiicola]